MRGDVELAQLAAQQHSLFTTGQARDVGVSDRMLARRVDVGLIVRVEPGVYRFAAASPTWHQRVLAACWAENGLASHRTAAALWGFDGCQAGIVEVVTDRWRRRPNPSVRVHETCALEEADREVVDGIPVTSKARTIVDLAAVLPATRVEAALDTHGLISPESVWECVERLDGRGRPWVAVSRRLVAARLGTDGVRPNGFEKRLFTVLQRAGLPVPEPQAEIRRDDGTLVGRVDWLYAADRVVLECDSFEWHGSWIRRKADFRRDRQLVALGYRVLRFSWEDVVEHQTQVAVDVAGALHPVSV